MDRDQKHAALVAERQAELDALARQRAQLERELAKGGLEELTEDQVWEFHAHEFPAPPQSVSRPLDGAIFKGVLSYVQTNKDVELLCTDDTSVWCNSSVLRATSGVLGLVGAKCSLPEDSSAAGLLCRVLHGEGDLTLADCAQVLPLLGKYACPAVEDEI